MELFGVNVEAYKDKYYTIKSLFDVIGKFNVKWIGKKSRFSSLLKATKVRYAIYSFMKDCCYIPERLSFKDFLDNVKSSSMISILKKKKLYVCKGARKDKMAYCDIRIWNIVLIETVDEISSYITSRLSGNTFFINLMLSNINPSDTVFDTRKTYILRGNDRGLYKIGMTTDIHRRQSAISNTVEECILIACVNGDIEKELHNRLRDYRITGEWFDLPDNVLKGIIREYKFLKQKQ